MNTGKMVGKVLEGTLTGDDGLHKVAEHGEHSETAILDFLHLELCECLGVVSKAEGVKAAPRVEWVDDLTERAASNTIPLDGTHEHHLTGPNSEDALGVDEAWVAKVVESALAEDLRAGLEPYGLSELDAIAGK